MPSHAPACPSWLPPWLPACLAGALAACGTSGGIDPEPDVADAAAGADAAEVAPFSWSGPCWLVDNAGCEPGQACILLHPSGKACSWPGKGTAGSACEGTTDCVADAVCVAGKSGGRCRTKCNTSLADKGAACKGQGGCASLSDPQSQADRLGACVPLTKCNLLTNDGCDPAEQCHPSTAPSGASCFAPGPVGAGGACQSNADCALGLACGNLLDGTRVCLRICDVTGALAAFACPPGKACLEVAVPRPDGTNATSPDHMGHCAP